MANSRAKDEMALITPEVKKIRLSSVQKAREIYAEKAALALQLFFKNIKRAMEAGDHETVSKALQWYMEHAPKAESGDRLLEPGIDSKSSHQPVVQQGPTIHLGVRLGGAPQQALLPAQNVIDLQPEQDGPTD